MLGIRMLVEPHHMVPELPKLTLQQQVQRTKTIDFDSDFNLYCRLVCFSPSPLLYPRPGHHHLSFQLLQQPPHQSPTYTSVLSTMFPTHVLSVSLTFKPNYIVPLLKTYLQLPVTCGDLDSTGKYFLFSLFSLVK